MVFERLARLSAFFGRERRHSLLNCLFFRPIRERTRNLPPARRPSRRSAGCCGAKVHKAPHSLSFVDSFPMTAVGKAQEYLTRRAIIEELAPVEEKNGMILPTATSARRQKAPIVGFASLRVRWGSLGNSAGRA
jgi:hypothetical protein